MSTRGFTGLLLKTTVLLIGLGLAGMLISFSDGISSDTGDWFPLDPSNSLEPGVIGMSDWLDAPAGGHGYLTMEGDDFVFEDGTRIKFWGTNHGNRGCGPEKEEAEKRADWYAKMGINAVRLHKFTYQGNAGFGHPENSSWLTDEGWDRLDYYMARLKERGIYYSWSSVYGHILAAGDSSRVVAHGEIRDNRENRTSGLINFAPDLQQVVIDLHVHMLEHRNPYTGLRYADDPALVSVELQNEDNIFWVFPRTVESCPTYKKMFCRQFSGWLLQKYGSHEEMVKAWGGEEALNLFPEQMTGEHLDKQNIYPTGQFSHYGEEAMNDPVRAPRLLDNARFLYELQEDYYGRFVEAVRETGYRGPLVGSCWQAGYGVIHYYNLYTDYEVGIIDRHNYFGSRPHRLETGSFPNASMFNHPGSGLISSGLMSVRDRPFVLSEWIVKLPTEWVADGPAIIGVYGMGLQDWDGSFHFASRGYGFSETMQNPNIYNTNNITQIGLFPALARMIYRDDVAEGASLPDRYVHVPSLEEGRIGFSEKVRQSGDIKELGGDVPIDALVKGKIQLAFADQYTESQLESYGSILEEDPVVSNTGQLAWYRDGGGCFTLESEGTVAVCGFAEGRVFQLGEFEITVESPYAMVFLTATEKDRTLESSRSILITTMARARDTGMEYAIEGARGDLLKTGSAPLLVEPVRATVKYMGERRPRVYVLDHDGLLTDQQVQLKKHGFRLDGAETKAFWYEMSMD